MSHLFMRWVTAGGYFEAYPGLHVNRKHIHDACFRRFTGSATVVTADTQHPLICRIPMPLSGRRQWAGSDKLSEIQHVKRNGCNVVIKKIMTLHLVQCPVRQ